MGLYDSLMRKGTDYARGQASRLAALIRYEITMANMELWFNRKGKDVEMLPDEMAKQVKVSNTEKGATVSLDMELNDTEKETAEQCFENAKKKLRGKGV